MLDRNGNEFHKGDIVRLCKVDNPDQDVKIVVGGQMFGWICGYEVSSDTYHVADAPEQCELVEKRF